MTNYVGLVFSFGDTTAWFTVSVDRNVVLPPLSSSLASSRHLKQKIKHADQLSDNKKGRKDKNMNTF